MKILKHRFFIGLICIILGAAVGFVVIPKVQANSGLTMVSAIRMKQDVPAGTLITAELTEKVDVQKGVLPAGALNDISSLPSRYSVTKLYAGDYLTNAKLGGKLEIKDTMPLAAGKGMTVISITLPDIASGVSGKIQPGDVVTVIATQKNSFESRTLSVTPSAQTDKSSGESEKSQEVQPAINNAIAKTQIFPALRYVEVCAVTANDGSDARVDENPDVETVNAKTAKNKLPVTVSLFVTEEQAILLAGLEQSSVMHLVFVARGDTVVRYIPDENRILNTEAEVR